MAGAFKLVGKVAGVVSTIAAFIPGGQAIAGIAGAVGALASTAAALTAKRPRAQGVVTQRLIGANNPQPYAMGRCYLGGVELHSVGWGGTVSKVENPYAFIAVGYSCCGPHGSIESFMIDRQPVAVSAGAATGYYGGFVWVDAQMGARPEPDALAPHWAGCPDWGADYKCSSWLAVGWSLLFDKKGKVLTGNVPELGIIGHCGTAYDPRLDSTFPGGSGPCRLNDEATWPQTGNPALHAGSYGYGRWVNGKLAFGPDMADAVDFGAVAAWANVCTANGWTIGGEVREPGDSWNNLKIIAQAGGGKPVMSRGVLTFEWHGPRVALDEISKDDLAQGPLESMANRRGSERINTARPKIMSEAHGWSLTQASAVKVAAFEVTDGEEKSEELPFELVTDKDQAAELALYEIWDRRDAGPFVVTVGPRLAGFAVGAALTLKADVGCWPTDLLTVVTRRSPDLVTGFVTLELRGEDSAKHAGCLGATTTLPPAPPLAAHGVLDAVIGANSDPYGYDQLLITTSSVSGASGSPLTASAGGADVTISIAAHSRDLGNGATMAINAGSIAGQPFGPADRHIFYDDPAGVGGAVTFQATAIPADALLSDAHPFRVYVGSVNLPASGAPPSGGSGGAPIGWGDGPLP